MNENDVLEQQVEERLSDIPTEPQLPEKDNSKKKKIITITAVIIIIIIILLLLQRCTNGGGPGKENETTTEPTSLSDIVPNNTKLSEDQLKEKGANGNAYVTFPGYSGQTKYVKEGDAYKFANPIVNTLDIIFTVSYEGQQIWQSQKVPAGSSVLWVVSDTLKNKGAYDLKLNMCPYFEDGSPASAVDADITVVLQ